jgi:hypothetical protein
LLRKSYILTMNESSVFRFTYLINKRNVIIKATPWLLLYYPLAKRWVLVLRRVICRFARPSVRSFVRSCLRPFDRINKNLKTKIIDSNRDTHTNGNRQANWYIYLELNKTHLSDVAFDTQMFVHKTSKFDVTV